MITIEGTQHVSAADMQDGHAREITCHVHRGWRSRAYTQRRPAKGTVRQLEQDRYEYIQHIAMPRISCDMCDHS